MGKTERIAKSLGAKEQPADCVPRWRALVRSLYPIRVISHRSLRGPFDRETFLDAMTAVHREAAMGEGLREKAVGIWKLERICFSYCRDGNRTLHGIDLPPEVQPISHTGLGFAATELAGFCAEGISGLIESCAHPDFRQFAYESIGCIWALQSTRVYRSIFRALSRTRIPRTRLTPWAEFVDKFPADVQGLLAHGHGRALYLKKFNLGSAVREAIALEGLDSSAAMQGIAFAYAMLNNGDLDRILDVGADFRNEELRERFQSGLVAALVFWDWTFPGFLDGLHPRSSRQEGLLDKAHERIGTCRRAGRLTNWLIGA